MNNYFFILKGHSLSKLRVQELLREGIFLSGGNEVIFYRNQMHYNYKSDERNIENIDSQKHTPH